MLGLDPRFSGVLENSQTLRLHARSRGSMLGIGKWFLLLWSKPSVCLQVWPENQVIGISRNDQGQGYWGCWIEFLIAESGILKVEFFGIS